MNSQSFQDQLGDAGQQWKRYGESMIFFDYPVAEMSRDDLLIVIGSLSESSSFHGRQTADANHAYRRLEEIAKDGIYRPMPDGESLKD